MSQEKTRFLSYICPRCRQSVIVEKDVFALAASPTTRTWGTKAAIRSLSSSRLRSPWPAPRCHIPEEPSVPSART